jgi:hypothetical protein
MNAADTRLDGSLLLQRALEYILPQVERAQYPELRAEQHVPTVNEGGPGADTITQVMIDYRGRAKISSAPGDDPPLVGIVGDAVPVASIKSIEAAYRITFQEVRAAAFAGIDISSEKAFGAKEMVMRESNRIAYLGDPGAGLYGLFTFPLLPKVLSPIVFDDPALDPNTMLRNLNVWSNILYDTITKRTFKSDAVLMPSRVRTIMNTTFRNANSDTTLMDLWRKSNPHITFIDDVPEADEAGFGGTPAMIFYKKDPSHVKRYIPQMLEQLLHKSSDTSKEVLIHERNGGVFFSRLSGVVVEGVLSQ